MSIFRALRIDFKAIFFTFYTFIILEIELVFENYHFFSNLDIFVQNKKIIVSDIDGNIIISDDGKKFDFVKNIHSAGLSDVIWDGEEYIGVSCYGVILILNCV